MKTEVKNLLTNEVEIYINNLSLTENIINSIITVKNLSSNRLNEKIRAKIKKDYKIIETTSKITNRKFAFCEEFNLHAKQTT
jgi:hypothetical protein